MNYDKINVKKIKGVRMLDQIYKLLLVDDEDEIRGRIASLINNNTGFKIVGKAGNGSDAYELVEQLKPDVVLTDIRMPYIDGLELARLIKRDFPTVKVAFISGYDEFNYAREAVNLNVINYLMKPVTSEDINVFLTDLKNKLDDEYERKFNINSVMKKYQESIPLIIDHEISNLIISSSINDADITKLKQYNLDVLDANHYGCLIEIENNLGEIELINLEKIMVLIKELASTLPKSLKIFHSLIIESGIFFVIKGFERDAMKILDMFLFEILQNSEQFLKLRLHIGVSERFVHIKDFPLSYQEAKKAISYSYLLNTGRIVYIKEVEKRKETKIVLSTEDVKIIENAVKFGTTEDVKKVLSDYRQEMKKQINSLINHKSYIVSLANLILTFSESINDDVSDIVGPNFLDVMLSFSLTDDLFDWTENILLELRERNIQSNISRTEQIMNDCLEYVDQNFQDSSLSLNMVCDVLDVSVSYLSMLLKKYKEVTFNKYVVKVRMNEAKRLLETTDDKIINIAEKCGYNEVYYFSHSFKKYAGVSPKKYRDTYHV